MAFVIRSERKIKTEIDNNTNLGPGQYENEELKKEARLLHKISNIYTHMPKKSNLEINIPFNSTCTRESLTKSNNNPGPGAYTDIFSYTKKKEEFPSLNKEIIFIEENGNLIPKFKNESKGFLSSEKRFNNIFDSNNNINIGPGCYNIDKGFNKTKIYNTRYGIMKAKSGNKMAKSLDNSIPTIPDKNRGDFKYINGEIKEVKKTINKGNELGPGQYNIYPNWNPKSIDWNFGLKKENKSDNFKNELINSFNENNNSVELKLNFNNASLSKSLNNCIKNKTSIKKKLEKNTNENNFIRNQVFKRFVRDRKKIYNNSMKKLKEHNDIILDFKYNDTPGPGFYDNQIIKGPISIFKSNKTQNFGSKTPQFFKIDSNNELIGPGSYFLEKNKYEPKFETIIHVKKPENKYKQKRKNIGVFIHNFRINNKDRQPCVGQYDLEKNFIKKEISNVGSFGILSERFKANKSMEDNEIDEEENEENKNDINKNNINNNYENKIKVKIDSKYIELKKNEEEEEKKRRDKYRDIKEPPVGIYSPEIITSLSYNVLSKINPYRSKVAPFNIMNTRFKKEEKDKIKQSELPGPGKYEVSNAYNALYGSKKTYNVFGAGPQRKKINNNNPGPGVYEANNPNSPWNKKTFNILFLEKINS